ncbi:hypothetical protein [uncultured Sphingomonas sp.]|uniref:hypothetical protein n=1 Tax=uncultured Sphingomonas sp. TaxID=158754 RepID=UPI003748C40A
MTATPVQGVPITAKPDPLHFPTDEYPRWRLRVFDHCWPWRVTRAEVFRDALLSRNARRCPDDNVTYLDAAAAIQRDPPFYSDRLRMRMKRTCTG